MTYKTWAEFHQLRGATPQRGQRRPTWNDFHASGPNYIPELDQRPRKALDSQHPPSDFNREEPEQRFEPPAVNGLMLLEEIYGKDD